MLEVREVSPADRWVGMAYFLGCCVKRCFGSRLFNKLEEGVACIEPVCAACCVIASVAFVLVSDEGHHTSELAYRLGLRREGLRL